MVVICDGQDIAGRPITIGAREQIDLMFNVRRTGSIAQETSRQDGSWRFDAQQVDAIIDRGAFVPGSTVAFASFEGPHIDGEGVVRPAPSEASQESNTGAEEEAHHR